MRYRTLGSTGIEVSEIGFGTWGIGGLSKGPTSYGPTDDKESVKALQRALDSGITLYDTSNVYGDGHSEELLGKTFSKSRDKVIIATKVGYSEHNSPKDFSSANLRGSLEQSLGRLKTDYVDVYQLHDASTDILETENEIIPTLKKLKKEGKIRAYGISVNSPRDVATAVKVGFPIIQVNFNMIDQRILDNGLIELISKNKVGLIARTPLCFGFLLGKYSPGIFGKDDHRSTWPLEQQKIWCEAPKLFSGPAKKEKSTPIEIALRYCLSFPEISSVIPGMLSAKEVDENVKAGTRGILKKETLNEIHNIYKQNTFFVTKNRQLT
ncbi:MAG: aldo/keto reductase [bacterium]|nr:aldo/keto reductase [bacterium]